MDMVMEMELELELELYSEAISNSPNTKAP